MTRITPNIYHYRGYILSQPSVSSEYFLDLRYTEGPASNPGDPYIMNGTHIDVTEDLTEQR